MKLSLFKARVVFLAPQPIIIKLCSRFLGQPRLQGSIIAQLVNWVLFIYGLRPHQTFLSKSFFTCLSTPYETDAYSAVVIF